MDRRTHAPLPSLAVEQGRPHLIVRRTLPTNTRALATPPHQAATAAAVRQEIICRRLDRPYRPATHLLLRPSIGINLHHDRRLTPFPPDPCAKWSSFFLLSTVHDDDGDD